MLAWASTLVTRIGEVWTTLTMDPVGVEEFPPPTAG